MSVSTSPCTQMPIQSVFRLSTLCLLSSINMIRGTRDTSYVTVRIKQWLHASYCSSKSRGCSVTAKAEISIHRKSIIYIAKACICTDTDLPYFYHLYVFLQHTSNRNGHKENLKKKPVNPALDLFFVDYISNSVASNLHTSTFHRLCQMNRHSGRQWLKTINSRTDDSFYETYIFWWHICASDFVTRFHYVGHWPNGLLTQRQWYKRTQCNELDDIIKGLR